MEFFNCSTKFRKREKEDDFISVVNFVHEVERIGEVGVISRLHSLQKQACLFGVNMERVQGFLPFFSVLNTNPAFVSIPSGDKLFQKELICLFEDFNCVLDFGNLEKEELMCAILNSSKKFVITNAVLAGVVDNQAMDEETERLASNKNCLMILNIDDFHLKSLAFVVARHIEKYGYFCLALSSKSNNKSRIKKFAMLLLDIGVKKDVIESILHDNAFRFWCLEIKSNKMMKSLEFSKKILLTNNTKVC